jgi:hypothetical protein
MMPLERTLDEIENAEITLLLVDGKDEVECRVVSVDKLDAIAPVSHT